MKKIIALLLLMAPGIAGAQSISGPTAVQPGKTFVFLSSQNWTPDPGFTGAWVNGCGAGGGGGGGALVAPSTAASGGAGGGGGSCTPKAIYATAAQIVALETSGSVPITVGAGGAAGLGATVASTAGGSGGVGGNTLFGTIPFGYGGGGGAGAQIGAGSGGGAGGTIDAVGTSGSGATGGAAGLANGAGGSGGTGVNADNAALGGGGGSGSSSAGVGVQDSVDQRGCPGGASGGGLSSTDTPNNGGSSYPSYDYFILFSSGVGGGVLGTPNGAPAIATRLSSRGMPGGGGYGGVSVGGNGGASTVCAGGSGGGSTENGYVAGNGATGGTGFVTIVETF